MLADHAGAMLCVLEPGAHRVADADEVAAKADELGRMVVVSPCDAPGFRAAVVADPQGAALTVGQPTAGP